MVASHNFSHVFKPYKNLVPSVLATMSLPYSVYQYTLIILTDGLIITHANPTFLTRAHPNWGSSVRVVTAA